jgi:hypothetical protein
MISLKSKKSLKESLAVTLGKRDEIRLSGITNIWSKGEE